jgi:fatty acid-binding protein DegV
MVERMAATAVKDLNHGTFYISHSDAADEALVLAEMVMARLGKREYMINDIGPVIGAHAGPGTLVLTFVGENRNPA